MTNRIGDYQTNKVYCADALSFLKTLPDNSINTCVSSPPYYNQRDYGVDGQIGLESSPAEYIDKLVAVFREVKRVLRDDGNCWINLGDSYASGEVGRHDSVQGRLIDGRPVTAKFTERQQAKLDTGLVSKNLMMIPARVAIALQADGWILRADVIWHKPSATPESVTDRPSRDFEHVFLLAKSARYFYDADAIAEPVRYPNGGDFSAKYAAEQPNHGGSGLARPSNPTRNKRSVWRINPEGFSGVLRTSRRVDVALGDISCGTKRIASPNCPMHESSDHWDSTYACDVHEADELNRIAGIYARLAQEQVDGFVPTALNDALGLSGQSLDSHQHGDALFATVHNNRNHKTGRAPATIPPYTPSSETTFHTEHTPDQLVTADQMPNTHESNISLFGEEVGHSLDETSGGKIHIHASELPPLCTCKFYREVTETTTHFAVMPEKLVEPCVLAGCPETCCAVCGAPYVRQVERKAERVNQKESVAQALRSSGVQTGGTEGVTPSVAQYVSRTSLGFAPTCSCDGGTRPGVVLDPFGGAATVGIVARRLKREFLLIELNPKYVEIANERLSEPYQLNVF